MDCIDKKFLERAVKRLREQGVDGILTDEDLKDAVAVSLKPVIEEWVTENEDSLHKYFKEAFETGLQRYVQQRIDRTVYDKMRPILDTYENRLHEVETRTGSI